MKEQLRIIAFMLSIQFDIKPKLVIICTLFYFLVNMMNFLLYLLFAWYR